MLIFADAPRSAFPTSTTTSFILSLPGLRPCPISIIPEEGPQHITTTTKGQTSSCEWLKDLETWKRSKMHMPP